MPEPLTHHLTLASLPESIRQVDPFLKGIAAVAALAPARYHDVLLAMTDEGNKTGVGRAFQQFNLQLDM